MPYIFLTSPRENFAMGPTVSNFASASKLEVRRTETCLSWGQCYPAYTHTTSCWILAFLFFFINDKLMGGFLGERNNVFVNDLLNNAYLIL